MAAAAVFLVLATGSAVAQDYSAAPTYGAVTLTTGFTPDPNVVNVQSGGNVDASALNDRPHTGNCVGNIADAPDVRLRYTAGSQFPLIISVDSRSDTTLVVNGPDGHWYCDDDGGVNGDNPAVRFAHPASGQYDIWIGTYGASALRDARLYFSEVSSR